MTDTSDTFTSTHVPACPSPASSTSSDSDAFNTADARIHFGPLRSTEKKFEPIVARRSTLHPGLLDSPFRRSPRLSTPQLRSPSPVQQFQDEGDPATSNVEASTEVIDVPLSTPGTPDIEQTLQDDPPSVLAMKISRAHDNPSPPPSPSTTTASTSIVSPSPRLPFRALHAMKVALGETNRSEDSTPPTSSNASPGLSKEFTPVLPTTFLASGRTNQQDLISFESFSTPAAVFRPVSPQASTSKLPHSTDDPSVDDLFFQSPSPSRAKKPGYAREPSRQVPSALVIEPPGADDQKGKGKASGEAFEESCEEQAVIDSLVLPAEGLYGGSSRSPPYNVETYAVTPKDVQTPSGYFVRRSRSGTSYQVAAVEEDHEMEDITHDIHPGHGYGEGDEPWRGRESGHEEGGTEGDEKAAETVRRKQMSAAPMSAFHRELGSLSPSSNELLSSLVASPARQPLPFSLAIAETATMYTAPDNPPRRPFPSFSQQLLPQTPQRSTSPVRFASPTRTAAQRSIKAGLQPVALNDPNRTPARRIPIAEAVAEGRVSPFKGPRFLPAGSRGGLGVLQTPILMIPPTDSPARRVDLSEATALVTPQKWQGISFGSPVRGASKERSESVEYLLGPAGSTSREWGGSVPPSQTKESTPVLRPTAVDSRASKPTHLPFPLIPLRKDVAAPIPEESQPAIAIASSTKPDRATVSSPSKSSLKQTTSRIPRTIKPYARPVPKPSDKGKPATTVMRRVNSTAGLIQSPAVLHKVPPTKHEVGSGSVDARPEQPASITGKAAAASSILKRKRVVTDKVSPPKPRPMVVLRQVPRASVSIAKPAVLPSVTLLAKKIPQHIRRVVDQPPAVQSGQLAPLDSEVEHPAAEGVDHYSKEAGGQEVASTDDAVTSSPEHQNNMSAPPRHIPTDVPPDGVRRSRTTRIRKPVNPTNVADVFGSSDGRALPSRRSANGQTTVRSDQTFSGMTATALKALTTSNTVRNQRYLAAKLETEVVRKEGTRPESPAVKIKTITQREQDERGRQRKERAERRARRSEDGAENRSEADGRSDDDFDSASDSDDQTSSPTPKRHKRGPGDEDDYQTPMRKLKRLKLGEDDGDDSRENERRVKWDRGLCTTIYLDEVKLGTRRPPKENTTMKGCLAPTAKALPLDNLGNLPHADSPLLELVEESVVVKKFVYDNDVEPEQQVIVVKNTRLRGKKGKN